MDQVGCALGLFGILLSIRIHDVMANVVFKQFRGQTADGAPDRRHQHQDVRTAEFGPQRTLRPR